ncbi:MAG: response regulator [Nitrospirae bacterium]|nr:response regulator [Nitrospirota bacterium]NTW65567.1 response regulator [Nitrospirota bacterium]
MPLHRNKVVIIGDDAVSLYTITELLADKDLRVIPIRQGSGTLNAVQFVRPALILLDNAMSATSGETIRELLGRDEEPRAIPRIPCSSTDGERLHERVQCHGTSGSTSKGDACRPGDMTAAKYFEETGQ